MKKTIQNFFKYFGYKLIKYNTRIEDSNDYEDALIKKCLNYSMTNNLRMWALLNSIEYVVKNNIPGDFVECGIWKGGNLILYKTLHEKYNLKNYIYGFDNFEGMPLPGKFDIQYDGIPAMKLYQKENKNNQSWCKSTLEEVEKNIEKNCSNLNNIKLIEGMVEKTLNISENIPKQISILRLDTDWYESTKLELEILYPRLVKGGILIIDDYGHFKGSKKAVDEYFKKRPFLIYIDPACRLLIKNSDKV